MPLGASFGQRQQKQIAAQNLASSGDGQSIANISDSGA
jgi:hypothetical protein